MQGGNGVALQHKDGKWSNPVAVNILSVGGGAVFGYANKCVIVLLNHFAMDRLLKRNGSIAIGVDAGFAVGKVGMYANHPLSSLLLASGFIYSSDIPRS
jgi:lipid-binding SYLF domain-containing protein